MLTAHRSSALARALIVSGAALVLLAAKAAPTTGILDCLYGEAARGGPASSDDQSSCTPSNAPIQNPTLRSVIRELHLSPLQIQFERCKNGRFATREEEPDLRGRRFTILYPERPGEQILAADLLPITHELGHAAQLEDAGGMGKLRRLLDLRKIELGADFLAGLALERAGVSNSILGYVTNGDLRGTYTVVQDDHGEPLDRVDAFRSGYFHDINVRGHKAARVAHLKFQAALLRNSSLVGEWAK